MAPRKMGGNNGCAFGKVTRNMVENLSDDFKEFKQYIVAEFKESRETNTQLYNHLSSRLPQWATIVITLSTSIITGLIVWRVTG